MRRPAFTLLLFVLTTLLLATACGGGTEKNASAGRIAFTSHRDGNPEIYVVNADGTGLTNLTNNPAVDNLPSWSPDGARIAFYSSRSYSGFGLIHIMNADGSEVEPLLDTSPSEGLRRPGAPFTPFWSPDGRKIAFSADGIYTMSPDGSGVKLLSAGKDDFVRAWSPDGKRIAYTYIYASYGEELRVMNADGTGTHAVADLGLGGTATWSPDGTRLVFDRANDLYVVNVDGSGLTNLTASSAAEGMASFSPDGEHIAFVSAADGRNGEIYVMNQDGSNVVRLTENTAQDVRPLWSPDGSQIAFISDRDGTMDIYVMNADGTDQTRITTDISLSMNWFVWSPARFDKAPDGSGLDSGAPTVQPVPTATTLPPTTPGETANLAPDPSFEASEGPGPGWTFYAGSQSILGGGNVDSVTAHSGSRSLRITGRVSSNTAGECLLPSDVGTWRTTSPIQINVEKSYVFSVWHLGDAIGSAAVLSVTLLDNSGMTLAEGGISFTTLAPGWATGSLTIGSSSFPHPRGTDSVLLSLGYAFSVQQPLRDACPEGDTASIWYDDVAFQEGP